MTKNIKDYIAYYVGQKVQSVSKDNTDSSYFGRTMTVTHSLINVFINNNKWKLILRPLSSMTEDEYAKIAEFAFTETVSFEEKAKIGKNFIDYNFLDKPLVKSLISDVKQFDTKIAFELTHYLLKQGLDLFGLIEAGLAIDATTLNK